MWLQCIMYFCLQWYFSYLDIKLANEYFASMNLTQKEDLQVKVNHIYIFFSNNAMKFVSCGKEGNTFLHEPKELASGVWDHMFTMHTQTGAQIAGSTEHYFCGKTNLPITTRQIRTPVLRIPPAVTSQAKMKNWLHECQKWVSHMIGHYAHI